MLSERFSPSNFGERTTELLGTPRLRFMQLLPSLPEKVLGSLHCLVLPQRFALSRLQCRLLWILVLSR